MRMTPTVHHQRRLTWVSWCTKFHVGILIPKILIIDATELWPRHFKIGGSALFSCSARLVKCRLRIWREKMAGTRDLRPPLKNGGNVESVSSTFVRRCHRRTPPHATSQITGRSTMEIGTPPPSSSMTMEVGGSVRCQLNCFSSHNFHLHRTLMQ